MKNLKFTGHYLNQRDKLLENRTMTLNNTEHRIDPKWTPVKLSQLTTGSKH